MAQVIVRSQGAGVQVRRAGAKSVTKRQLATFLAELAKTCNVQASCRKAKLGDTTVYTHRKKTPGFAAAWQEAICEGYGRLELLLLENAVATFEVPDTEDAGKNAEDGGAQAVGAKAAARPRMSDASAMRLLQFHRQQVTAIRAGEAAAQAQAGQAAEDAAQAANWLGARAELEARLLQMHERLTHDGE